MQLGIVMVACIKKCFTNSCLVKTMELACMASTFGGVLIYITQHSTISGATVSVQ